MLLYYIFLFLKNLNTIQVEKPSVLTIRQLTKVLLYTIKHEISETALSESCYSIHVGGWSTLFKPI